MSPPEKGENNMDNYNAFKVGKEEKNKELEEEIKIYTALEKLYIKGINDRIYYEEYFKEWTQVNEFRRREAPAKPSKAKIKRISIMVREQLFKIEKML